MQTLRPVCPEVVNGRAVDWFFEPPLVPPAGEVVERRAVLCRQRPSRHSERGAVVGGGAPLVVGPRYMGVAADTPAGDSERRLLDRGGE